MSIFLSDFTLGNKTISVRGDEYRYGLYFVRNGSVYPADERHGFSVSETESISGNEIVSRIEIRAKKETVIEKLFLRSGIDCYMDRYPQWNDVFFPTFLLCEPTHFTGYLMTPNQTVLALAAPCRIEAWSLEYNRAQYGEENHVGHRIYTFNLHLIDRTKEVFQGKKGKTFHEGDRIEYCFTWRLLDNLNDVYPFFEKITGAAPVLCNKWTYEIGEKPVVIAKGKIEITDPTGKEFAAGGTVSRPGVYTIRAKYNNTLSVARFYVRETTERYLQFAGKWALKCPPRPSTHAETYYGFFSAFQAARYEKKNEFTNKIFNAFDRFLGVMLTPDEKTLVEEALPKRIQNLSTMISLLCEVYKTSGREKYLEISVNLAYTLMGEQAGTGEYLGWGHAHYTCVIYPMKSLLELYSVLEGKKQYSEERKAIFDSVSRAAEDLSLRLDNIETEGQQTFEDGMITCAALQLSLMALYDSKNRERYTRCALELMKKHECLEQKLVPDCRMRGATLRFWESMYDVLINKNMINSPHGWTSWKTYATFYLYLLTCDPIYLQDTFDTLGACLQCFDMEKNRLYWAFIADPVITADIFSYRNGCKLTPSVIGECYLPMISDRWRSDLNGVCYGYAFPHEGKTEGIYRGGCCDNDVHEHIKCMEEVACNAFVHERLSGNPLMYGCEMNQTEIFLRNKICKKLYYYALNEKRVFCNNKKYELKQGMNVFDINNY